MTLLAILREVNTANIENMLSFSFLTYCNIFFILPECLHIPIRKIGFKLLDKGGKLISVLS